MQPPCRLLSTEDRGKYQDIALAVAKVACLASNASKDAEEDANTSLVEALSAFQACDGKSGTARLEVAPIMHKTVKTHKGGGKEGGPRSPKSSPEGLSPRVLLQARSFTMALAVCFGA